MTKHSMSGHHRHARETKFKWRFAGGPMIACLYRIWIISSKKKNVAKLGGFRANQISMCLDPHLN